MDIKTFSACLLSATLAVIGCSESNQGAMGTAGSGGTGGAGGTGEAKTTWTRFTDELAKAEEVVDDLIPDPVRETGILPVPEGAVYDRTPQDDRNRAEGFRQLTRLLRLGLWSIGEYGFGQMGDEHSQVFLATDPTNSTGATTSNALYFGMFPNGTDTYRISGDRGTFPLIEFNLQEGRVGYTPSASTVDFLTEREMVFPEEGRFEVWISPECESLDVDNCLTSTPETTWLLIRQYAAKPWKETSMTFHVDNTSTGQGKNPATDLIRTEAEYAERLVEAAKFARNLAQHFKGNQDLTRFYLQPNHLLSVNTGGGNALPNGHSFTTGHFELQPDEALVVEFEAPNDPVPPFWGFQVVDYWYRPIDYWSRMESSVSNETATPEADGSYKLIMSAQDPGMCNWLDLKGYTHGGMQFRLSRDIDQPRPDFALEVVKVAELQAAPPEQLDCLERGPDDPRSPLMRLVD
jgi:hypothetical protein